MENDIYLKIINSRKGDNKSLLEVIEIFNPLIRKYSRLLDGEDTKQDLIIQLMEIINNIPIENEKFYANKAIIGYISKSVRNEYIKLSMKRDKINFNEMELNLDIEIGYEDFESDFELLDMFNILTKREAYIMKLLYMHYLSVNEVAEYMKVSRQAINQSKNRSLKKIKKMYLEE